MTSTNQSKYKPEYLFWRKRIEGQIRHTMNEHPEYFTELAYTDNMIGSMAKRIIGEIVAGIAAGNNHSVDAKTSVCTDEKNALECFLMYRGRSMVRSTVEPPFITKMNAYETYEVYQIIERNGIAFMWPEKEI